MFDIGWTRTTSADRETRLVLTKNPAFGIPLGFVSSCTTERESAATEPDSSGAAVDNVAIILMRRKENKTDERKFLTSTRSIRDLRDSQQAFFALLRQRPSVMQSSENESINVAGKRETKKTTKQTQC